MSGLSGKQEVSLASENATPVRFFDLGTVHKSRVRAEVYFDNTGPGTFGEFKVVFHIRNPDKSQYRFSENAGSGILAKTKIQADDFVGSGHKQLFVSAEMGGVTNNLFDYDGKKLKSIYQDEGGRVHVSFQQTKDGKWKLTERWGRRFYEENSNFGVAYMTGVNAVERTLHWNGKRFVPDKPGLTTVRER